MSHQKGGELQAAHKFLILLIRALTHKSVFSIAGQKAVYGKSSEICEAPQGWQVKESASSLLDSDPHPNKI